MKAGRAQFITLEGVEGAGKSTNLTYLCELLDARGIDYIVTREPGGTPVAERLRECLLAEHEEPIDGMAELLMIFAARAQHLANLVVPALERGQWVVCDRFTDATFAYQGGGRELGFETVEALESMVQRSLHPDLTIVLDVPVDVSMERTANRGELDRFEKESQAFFERVRSAYQLRLQRAPERYRLVDASQPLPQVKAVIKTVLEDFLGAAG